LARITPGVIVRQGTCNTRQSFGNAKRGFVERGMVGVMSTVFVAALLVPRPQNLLLDPSTAAPMASITTGSLRAAPMVHLATPYIKISKFDVNGLPLSSFGDHE
jgi:hypothetical protein